jgi:hypothetical protein
MFPQSELPEPGSCDYFEVLPRGTGPLPCSPVQGTAIGARPANGWGKGVAACPV